MSTVTVFDSEGSVIEVNKSEIVKIEVRGFRIYAHTIDAEYQLPVTFEDRIKEFEGIYLDRNNAVIPSKVKKLDESLRTVYFDTNATSQSKHATISYSTFKKIRDMLRELIIRNNQS